MSRTGINDSLYKIGYVIDTVKVISLKEFVGPSLYHKNCSMCHGNEGKGDGVVARHNEEWCTFDLSKENKSDDNVYYIILKGKNKMPSKEERLTEDEIWVLVIYIKKFRE